MNLHLLHRLSEPIESAITEPIPMCDGDLRPVTTPFVVLGYN